MKKIMLGIALTTSMIIAGCSDHTKENDAQTVSILYPSWADGVALTNLADVALTNHGVNVKTTLVEPGPLYASLAKGDADIYLDAWLPNTHAEYWERFGDNLDVVGVAFNDASTGLVVPQYVDINSITDLNDKVSEFGGKIYGIGAGAGIHGMTLNAIDEYDLKYEQITSSESAMMAELRGAINDKKPIVITGWKPHYMWDLYDIKILEDPKSIYQLDEIKIVSRKGFKDDSPEIATFFSNFTLNSDEIHELMSDITDAEQNGKPAKEGASKFYEKYKERIDGWWK